MKLKLFNIFFFIICSAAYGQGLLFDSSSFNQQQEFPIDRAAIPNSASLEMYLPALYPQTGGTCVAMSVTLARTILYATSFKVTDVAEITRNQMSPYFLYYYARDKGDLSCDAGLNPVKALEIAKQIGFEKLMKIEYPNHWPFTKNFLCPAKINFIPPETQQHLINAKKYRISDFFVTKSIEGIKTALAKNIPVILAMQIPNSFEYNKSSTWTSLSTENRAKASGHAMVAIGYNDDINGGSIRIANSWGTEWGDNGKVWINYEELKFWLDGAFIMIPLITNYKLDKPETLPQYKLSKSKTFKSTEYNGRFNFNNKDYINLFTEQ